MSKKIKYISTRGGNESLEASEAIIQGLSNNGGLFVPTSIPMMDFTLEELLTFDYKKLAYEVMSKFLSDFSETELRNCIDKAYDKKFETEEIAPLVQAAGVAFLELYHGPTLAFKDMALTILPHLLTTAVKKQNSNKEIVILTATSGDTGKAALDGFANVPGTSIIVFYPKEGVSEIQKRQMTTQEGSNTHVIGIEGNFDDAQTGVKNIFADIDLSKKLSDSGKMFSSANSINIGRLIPQIVYYFHAYKEAVKQKYIKNGDTVNFTVPTGNFGNILAGYYAKQMGLPIGKLICASNENNVLTDFIQTGIYNTNRPFKLTKSPSMDILVSSNLERLLYHISNNDSAEINELMNNLSKFGLYEVTSLMKVNLHEFIGGYTTEEETDKGIENVFNETGYVMDTHTAVAYSVNNSIQDIPVEAEKSIIISTASPYKFAADVLNAIDPNTYSEMKNEKDISKILTELSQKTKKEIPPSLRDLHKKPELHNTICRINEMKKLVEAIVLD